MVHSCACDGIGTMFHPMGTPRRDWIHLPSGSFRGFPFFFFFFITPKVWDRSNQERSKIERKRIRSCAGRRVERRPFFEIKRTKGRHGGKGRWKAEAFETGEERCQGIRRGERIRLLYFFFPWTETSGTSLFELETFDNARFVPSSFDRNSEGKEWI